MAHNKISEWYVIALRFYHTRCRLLRKLLRASASHLIRSKRQTNYETKDLAPGWVATTHIYLHWEQTWNHWPLFGLLLVRCSETANIGPACERLGSSVAFFWHLGRADGMLERPGRAVTQRGQWLVLTSVFRRHISSGLFWLCLPHRPRPQGIVSPPPGRWCDGYWGRRGGGNSTGMFWRESISAWAVLSCGESGGLTGRNGASRLLERDLSVRWKCGYWLVSWNDCPVKSLSGKEVCNGDKKDIRLSRVQDNGVQSREMPNDWIGCIKMANVLDR